MFVDEHVLFVLQVRCDWCGIVSAWKRSILFIILFAFMKVSKNIHYLL